MAWRLRTVVRTLTQGSLLKRKHVQSNQETDADSPEPAEKKIHLSEDQEASIRFLKFASPSSQKDEIFQKMKETFEVRKHIFTLEDFPRFLDTPGLVRNI